MPSRNEGAGAHKLRPGRNGLARDQVSDIQRARMVAAMSEVAAERGAGSTTVAHVVERSGVSRRTFYEHFVDREECFLAAFDEAIKRIVAHVVPAYEQPGKWRDRTRTALIELLSYLDNDPVSGRLVIVETLGAGPRALERRGHVLAQIVSAVDEGRREAKKGTAPPPLAAEGIVGGVLSLIHSRLLGDDRSSLLGLTGPLMSMIVLPYLGPAAAQRELARSVPVGEAKTGAINPLKNLEMRLTYRTVRVLIAIGANPGVSNRRVGDEAGITDQGQVSKLLARLDKLGLIENSGFGQAKGESNSWHLTPRGREIELAIREQTQRR